MANLTYNQKKIHFTDKGKGDTLVFLHGFLESAKIWKGFSKKLSDDFRVITIDLPGHGESENVDEVHSMELQADVVFRILEECKVRKCLMTGHSMGGYVTLAFADKHPEMLKGICIFHSHIFADSEQDRENRDRMIRVVEENKFGYVVQFIRSLFPEEVHEKFAPEIEQLIGRANEMQKESIIAALRGMKIRKDQSQLLSSLQVPVLFILGLKDSKAPLSRLWEMISLPAHSESMIMKDTGHMGYIEESGKTLSAIMSFAARVFRDA
jgi:pimeloyl-ACP methyl ester carboxylesterase